MASSASSPAAPKPPRLSPALVVLGIACILPELLLQGADHGLWGSARWRPMTYAYGAFWAGILYGWTPNFILQPATMFVTHAFLHADALHLIVNMVTLVSFGTAIIARVGAPRFLWVYAASIIGGGIGFALLTSSPRPMVGASGALFGLVGAWIIWEFREAWTMAGEDRDQLGLLGRGLILPAAVLILLNIVMYFSTGGFLAWETHLGGFVAGSVMAVIFPSARPIIGDIHRDREPKE